MTELQVCMEFMLRPSLRCLLFKHSPAFLVSRDLDVSHQKEANNVVMPQSSIVLLVLAHYLVDNRTMSTIELCGIWALIRNFLETNEHQNLARFKVLQAAFFRIFDRLFIFLHIRALEVAVQANRQRNIDRGFGSSTAEVTKVREGQMKVKRRWTKNI